MPIVSVRFSDEEAAAIDARREKQSRGAYIRDRLGFVPERRPGPPKGGASPNPHGRRGRASQVVETTALHGSQSKGEKS